MKSEYKIEGHGKYGKRVYHVYLQRGDAKEYITDEETGEIEEFKTKAGAQWWATHLNALYGYGDFAR